MRTRTLLLLAVVVTAVPIGVEVLTSRDTSVRDVAARRVESRSPAVEALAVLHRWDHRRARAWAVGDATSLARLYARGSATGSRDVADLRRWHRRGLRVTGLREQVAAFRAVRRTSDRLVVVVSDRTVDGVAVGAGRRTAVPASGWVTHRITLVRSGHRWQVLEARAQPAR